MKDVMQLSDPNFRITTTLFHTPAIVRRRNKSRESRMKRVAGEP